MENLSISKIRLVKFANQSLLKLIDFVLYASSEFSRNENFLAQSQFKMSNGTTQFQGLVIGEEERTEEDENNFAITILIRVVFLGVAGALALIMIAVTSFVILLSLHQRNKRNNAFSQQNEANFYVECGNGKKFFICHNGRIVPIAETSKPHSNLFPYRFIRR